MLIIQGVLIRRTECRRADFVCCIADDDTARYAVLGAAFGRNILYITLRICLEGSLIKSQHGMG